MPARAAAPAPADGLPLAAPGIVHATSAPIGAPPAADAETARPVPPPADTGTLRSTGPDPALVGAWAEGSVPGIHREGEVAIATVRVDGRAFELLPNQLGVFPRVYVAPSARVEVVVRYPNAPDSQVVTARMMDGGSLGGPMTRRLSIGAERSIAFPATVSDQAGTHRIALTVGSDLKTLDLWVGPPLPARSLASR